jgi:hypothetical protein
VLSGRVVKPPPEPGAVCYGGAVREALVVLWEASDRLCSKRLRPLIPVLLPALERHGRLDLDAELRGKLLTISAATMDRLLSEVRVVARGGLRRRAGLSSAVRRSVPVRTFGDWHDPPPGLGRMRSCPLFGAKRDGRYWAPRTPPGRPLRGQTGPSSGAPSAEAEHPTLRAPRPTVLVTVPDSSPYAGTL